jgi:hypothetical protein
MLLLMILLFGDRINEIAWKTSKEAFAQDKKWVLVYMEWPR